MAQDIRWIQRFYNFKKALSQLLEAKDLSEHRELSLLEKQGVIQAFEYTHELAWKTLKDFLDYKGSTEQIYGSRDATREAFSLGLLSNGDDWMKMIQSRNLTSHTYNEKISQEIMSEILENYLFRFKELEMKFTEILKEESR